MGGCLETATRQTRQKRLSFHDHFSVTRHSQYHEAPHPHVGDVIWPPLQWRRIPIAEE